MARYLFVPYPMHGHVNPMVPVAAELVARGETVNVAVAAPFADVFREVGCDVTEIVTTVVTDWPENPTKEQRRRNRQAALRMFRERRGVVRRLRAGWPQWRPDVVVSDLAARWGQLAALRERTPLASFSVTYTVSEEMVVGNLRRQRGDRYVRTIRRLGLLHQFHPALRDRAELALVNATPHLQPRWETFGDRYHFVGPLLRDTSGYGDTDLPWERIERGPTLFFSPGTVFGCGPQFFRALADAFADTEWTVVMATAATDPAELGDLPPNVIARRYVPQSAVLSRSSVFLTRASMNSVLEAVRHEVPMIAVPRAYDQRGVAARLQELGVAVVLDQKAPGATFVETADRLRSDPDVASALERMAEPMREAAPVAAAADALQKFTQNR
ncbi:nucleotide disphospho-sugar-binding domain-containing protein [Plantactinospora endophytica]|uniref:Oleandomycin glycosyltransferase n=1 Tax=Plantactinospora endophytica TaxID=673535 RepID=A0ABQ4E6P8_9ACTN|nr:nucleotide disphospho-sugar-binding domain-containing protein [Plantactinospora endophytica]GIG90334.1 oleandomycin glycosyltransferase [Plantactinospora endophytica]